VEFKGRPVKTILAFTWLESPERKENKVDKGRKVSLAMWVRLGIKACEDTSDKAASQAALKPPI
jgi:hypothetical protein